MSQHDYVIDNSTGANVRSDINSVLQAIASNNSGSSAPSTTYAFQLFADTTNNVMKIRNSANNAFIELFQLDGTFTLEDGSASTPALAFRDDLNTGIFSGGADEINISTGGTERFVINSSGNCGIGTTSPDAALVVQGSSGSPHAVFRVASNSGSTKAVIQTVQDSDVRFGASTNHPLTFFQNSLERVRIDTSGRLLIGQTSGSGSGKLNVSASISGGGQAVIVATDTSSNDFGCGLRIEKTSTTTSSSQRFIQFFSNTDGQAMGGIVGNGAERAQFLQLSDERWKKNIKPLSGILEKVNKLDVVSFDWKHVNESVEAGFIAQNVQKIFPEYVSENIANEGEEARLGTTGGMAGGYIAILTAAIQELSAKVAALEAS